MGDEKVELRGRILDLMEEYIKKLHPPQSFVPGETYITYAGTTFDSAEHANLFDVLTSHWYAYSKFEGKFVDAFNKFLGKDRRTVLTNSGSSANLIALGALASSKTGLEDRLMPGDEVITVASGFPTTVNPILQNNMVPVFLDVNLGDYNIDVSRLDDALSDKTAAIMVAHTLGNPFNLNAVMDFAKRNNLWVIEDTCDALGSSYDGKATGTFGDLSTFSFYPAHHITMGEGGAVSCQSGAIKRAVTSIRDWGRDCWCDPGKDNTCGKRFGWDFKNLPKGYDHKYVYGDIGYNLKGTDFSPALGYAQLKKMAVFGAARRRNADTYTKALEKYSEFLLLPQATEKSDPCWFAYPVYVKENAPFTRKELQEYLESCKISTRTLFSGNILRHPAYQNIQHRVVGGLDNSDKVMKGVFFFGVWQGITPEIAGYITDSFDRFFEKKGIKR